MVYWGSFGGCGSGYLGPHALSYEWVEGKCSGAYDISIVSYNTIEAKSIVVYSDYYET